MSRRRLEQLVNQMGGIVGDMHTMHFRYVTYANPGWEPLMNVYRYPDHYEVCLELAGVDEREIQVLVRGRLLSISGERHWPDLRCQKTGRQCRRTTMMEIPQGEFRREVELPEPVDGRSAEIRADRGLVWIRLQLLEG